MALFAPNHQHKAGSIEKVLISKLDEVPPEERRFVFEKSQVDTNVEITEYLLNFLSCFSPL